MYIPSIIKKIQRGTITLNAAVTVNTAVLGTAAPLASSRLRYLGMRGGNASGDSAYLELTNPTTVTATRIWSNSAIIIGYEVTTYYPAFVRSIQRGLISVTAGGAGSTGTLAITAVTVAKSELSELGVAVSDNASGLIANQTVVLDLTSTILVTGTLDGNLGTFVTASVEVVEFR